jgi:chromosome segregation ATPase
LRKRSDYWQTCATATQALREVRDSVFPEYQEASRLREQVQTALKGATSRARRMRNAWPPSFTTSEVEILELEKVEEQWKALKGSRTRAAWLANQLNKLSSRYQNLSERIDQNTSQIAQEQLQVEKLELEIHDMSQYWENLMNVYRENPVVVQEISDLLDSIDREQAEIRQDYKHGDLTYDQVMQDMKSLHNRIRHFQATLDEDRALEYGGAIRSRR